MGNVTLPTPVALAGGAICILGGYLLGVVAGPDAPGQTTATVESFDSGNGELCLSVDAGQEAASEDGSICGTWRRTEGSKSRPEPGDQFRFVAVDVGPPPEGEAGADRPSTVIYGDVVR